jgi:hypothetical protein
MYKNKGAYLLGIITVVVMMTSCTKETSYTHDSRYFKNFYYFKGKVFGDEKYYKEGRDRYFNDFRNGYDAGHGYTEFGLTPLAPEQPGDERIYVAAAKDGASNAREVNRFLAIGKQPFYDYGGEGLGVTYFLNDSTGTNGCVECAVRRIWTSLGPQDGMSIEVLSIQPVDNAPVNGSQKFEIAVKINCNLYDLDGNFVGIVKDGLIVSQVLVAL